MHGFASLGLIPVLGKRALDQRGALVSFSCQQLLRGRDWHPTLRHGPAQQWVVKDAHAFRDVANRALDCVCQLLKRPAARPEQPAQRVRLLLGRQILPLEILDQVDHICVVFAHRADKGSNRCPTEQPRRGDAPHSRRQDEAVAGLTNADRLLEPVILKRLRQRGNVAQEPTCRSARQVDAREGDFAQLRPNFSHASLSGGSNVQLSRLEETLRRGRTTHPGLKCIAFIRPCHTRATAFLPKSEDTVILCPRGDDRENDSPGRSLIEHRACGSYEPNLRIMSPARSSAGSTVPAAAAGMRKMQRETPAAWYSSSSLASTGEP